MTEGFTNFVIDGNGNLVIPSEQSPNFQSGITGWQIRADGSVEFNAGTFRGTITTAGDILLYSPAAGAGNLVFALSGTGNTDQYGNSYPAGISLLIGSSGTNINTFPGAVRWGITAAGTADQLPHMGSVLQGVFPFDTVYELAGKNSVVAPGDQRARIQLTNLGAGGSKLTMASENGQTVISATTGILLTGAPIQAGASSVPYTLEQWAKAAVSFAAVNRVNQTVTFPVTFAGVPAVLLATPEFGSNFDIVVNTNAIVAASFNATMATRSAGAITGTGNLHWFARL